MKTIPYEEVHLGEGVYVSCDGFKIIFRKENDGDDFSIDISSDMMKGFVDFLGRVGDGGN